jgi:ATP-dependent protease HslVU (ClpYQ) peptidase subunit
MTCIVGLVGKKGVLIAGDAQGSTSWTKREDTQPKVFQLSDVLAIGYCGSGRFGQIMQYHVMEGLEEPSLLMDEHRWVVKEFIPHLREVIYAHGHLHISHDDNSESFGPSASLLAVRGRLFTIWDDFGVDEHVLPFDSIGSGAETATGAMHAELGEDTEPIADSKLEGIAVRAITAAAQLTLYVGGAISSVKTTRYTDEEKALARRIASGR